MDGAGLHLPSPIIHHTADPHQMHQPAGAIQEERHVHAAHYLEDGAFEGDHYDAVGKQDNPPVAWGTGRQLAMITDRNR